MLLGTTIGLIVGFSMGFILCAVLTMSKTTELLKQNAELEGKWKSPGA